MPSLLIVDDDRSIIRIFQRCFEHTDVTVYAAGSGCEATRGAAELKPDVVVLDIHLPDGSGLDALEAIRRQNAEIPVILVTASGASDLAIESTRLGAMDFLTKPLDVAKVRDVVSQAIRISTRIRLDAERDHGEEGNGRLDAPAPAATLLGTSPAMQEVYKAIGRVAGQNINVLIRGESGTGKELVARAVHQHSNRAKEKFLAVNCAAIPEQLLESELFGHEKGSFTGAAGQRIGKFEECDGGTLFLDEVGDMPLLMQSKVLRAIQEKEFQRVGGNHVITSDVRILAATNRDIEAMVLREEFRADLSFRLNGYEIVIPSLRDRREDIPLLVDHYLRIFNGEIGKSITGVAPETMELLQRYPWPGNIRELQTVLKHAMLHSIGPTLLPEFLPPELRKVLLHAALPGAAAPEGNASPPGIEPRPSAPRQAATLDAPAEDDHAGFMHFVETQIREGTRSLYADSVHYMESILLTHILRYTNGNQSRAAALLGITRGCLRGKLRMHGIMISSSVAIQESGEAAPPTPLGVQPHSAVAVEAGRPR